MTSANAWKIAQRLRRDALTDLNRATSASHMEMRRVPRWPRFGWLRWVKKDEFYAVIDKYHLTGVSFDGYPGERDVTIIP